MKAYKEGILLGGESEQTALQIAQDYIETTEYNIEFFLKDKTNKMLFSLENAVHDFEIFYNKIAAKGDLQAALNEFTINHNAS